MQNYLLEDYPKVASWIEDNYKEPANDQRICHILNDLDEKEIHVHNGATLTAEAADYVPVKDKTFQVKSEERFWKELRGKLLAGLNDDHKSL